MHACLHAADTYTALLCSQQGVSPLAMAVTMQKVAMVAELLECEANVTSSDARGTTPLHIAAKQGNEEIVRLLLDRQADVSFREHYAIAVRPHPARPLSISHHSFTRTLIPA
jgi:ankyrin repeat protein